MALIVTLVITLMLPLVIGALFAIADGQEQEWNEELTVSINGLLPQTQCGACGYPDCRSYAEAIVAGATDIQQCPPGGAHTVNRLAELLEGSALFQHTETFIDQPSLVARIDELICIGCVKCSNACPVDAIIGAAKQMHTVMPKACTGCGLCIAPCPVDCITMVPAETMIKRFVWSKPGSVTAGVHA